MATRVDLNGIKTQIKTLLDSANTTTASPIDLSSGLSRRVAKVLKVNPEMIPPQASFFPFVTSYVESKDIVKDDIASNQLSSKRRAIIKIHVVGAVFNQNLTSVTEDPADEDINYLMENVELILRSDPALSATVNFQRPTDVKYYSSILNQQTHLRAGILALDATVFY